MGANQPELHFPPSPAYVWLDQAALHAWLRENPGVRGAPGFSVLRAGESCLPLMIQGADL